MKTKVSTKGQVVLPGPLRRRLDIRAGDALDVDVKNGQIVLSLRSKRTRAVKLVTDPVTGLPALTAGPKAPALSNKEVEEILANFP
jgi:AbrB family looped-hinge helix DNA binding protein